MKSSMPTAEEAIADIIARQPEDSGYDEILRELAYARMVQQGLAHSDAGRTVLNSEVREIHYGHYRIADLIRTETCVEVFGIFHGAMDICRYFK